MNNRSTRIRIHNRIAVFALLCLAVPVGVGAQAPASEPLTLGRAVELALARAPGLAAARAAREEGAASAELARDAFSPSAYFSTTPGYTYGLPTLIAGHVPSVFGVEIQKPIFDPARRSDALRVEASASALDASLALSCRATMEAAVSAYGRSYLDGVMVEAARRRLEASEAIARRVTALFEEGRRTELEVESATLQAARARQKLLNAESDRDLGELELKRLIGWPGSAPLHLAGDPEAVVPELTANENVDAVRSADPELASLEREVTLLAKSADIESKRWMPTVVASAAYRRLAKFNNYDDYYLTFTPDSVAVGVSIIVPIWTGGRFEDERREARARFDRAEAALRTRESDVEMAVRRAEAAVARSMAERSISRRARGIADRRKSAEELLVREGRSELVELDEREMALADADDEAAQASLTSLLERVHLLSLRGELGTALLGTEPPCAAP
jgi:outer membrane protein TolC